MKPTFQFVTINLAGKVRKETLYGREYLVAPATLIVGDSVLNGSQGPLLYPKEEVRKDPWAWNGMPLVVYHPTEQVKNEETGKMETLNVSARDPKVLNEWGVGQFFHADASDDLAGEAWFDVQNTKRVDLKLVAKGVPAIYPKLLRGEPIELSTGLFTENVPAPQGSVTSNGTPYSATATAYRPDHVAILPDELGACSVKDGCGVNNSSSAKQATTNQATTNKGSPMKLSLLQRKAHMRSFTANCACQDKKVLNEIGKLGDKHLVALSKLTKAKAIVNRLTVNAEGEEESEVPGVDIAGLAEFLGITTDPASDPVGFVNELKGKLDAVSSKLGVSAPPPDAPEVTASEESEMPSEELEANVELPEEPVAVNLDGDDCTGEDNDDPECRAMFHAVSNARNGRRRQAPASNRLTAEEREDIEFARAEKNRRKRAIVNQLLVNVSKAKRQEMGEKLFKLSLNELNDRLELLPKAQTNNARGQQQSSGINWGLGDAGPTFNANGSGYSDDDADDVESMTPPVWNSKTREFVKI